jgi:hypothetical protein
MTGKQLDLFEGVLLTDEQQEKVNTYIANCKQNSEYAQKKHAHIVALLLTNGFCKGLHFEENCKVFTDTRKVTLGHRYNETTFETEITAEYCIANVYLVGQSFSSYQGELSPAKFYFETQSDKIQCGSITKQYRFYKPSTILEKLKSHNLEAVNSFEVYKKKINLEKNTIEKYTKLYPNATIEAKDGYSKYAGSYRLIEVKFESGSYVQFRLDAYKNEEYMCAKHDASTDKLTAEELLDRFSKQ